MPDLRFFQGRRAKQAELNGWLADAAVALVGIRGEGGIGKSTLMAKVFAESLGFAGKFWADVRTGSSMAAVAGRALQELSVPPTQVEKIEEKDLIPRLLRLLQQGRYLLAIDNLESVLTATGDWQGGYDQFLEGFQDLGSGSVLLLGSREYPPKYFGWQRSKWSLVEHGLKPTEGAALLAALEVEDTPENRVAVSVQVQGNPLALALLAGWLRQEYRPGERTVARLQQTDLWQVEGRHRGESQVSVERVLQWSLERLPPTLQHLITQVSVLRGTFNYIAAATLALEQSVTETDLDDLERRSLLQTLPERDKYKLRTFRLQPRIREFVQKRAADLTTAHERAISYFWNSRQVEFATEGTLSAIAEYEETFYHQCQLSRYPDAAGTVFACDRFLRLRGYYSVLVVLYSQLHTDWQPTSTQLKDYAGVCNNLGNVYGVLGEYQKAITLMQQSLKISCEIDDRRGEANSLGNLGDVHQSLGKHQEAMVFHESSLIIKRETGDRSGEAASLGNLGAAYDSLGQYQDAITFQQQSLEIRREIGDRSGEAASLGNLGNVYGSLGQYQDAIALHQQSLDIYREIGNRSGEAASLVNLGNAYRSLGQYQGAIALYQQSLDIYREISNRSGEANSLTGLGNAYDSLGQYQDAIALYQQSLEISREIDDRSGEANSLGNLGNAYGSLGQYQQAIAFQQQALEIRRELGDRSGEAASLVNLGVTYQALGQYQQAIAFYQQALAIYEALKLDHMVEKCKIEIEQCTQPIPVHQRSGWWQNWGLWFAVGLAIALLIWWLR